jgi:hypothetical protein
MRHDCEANRIGREEKVLLKSLCEERLWLRPAAKPHGFVGLHRRCGLGHRLLRPSRPGPFRSGSGRRPPSQTPSQISVHPAPNTSAVNR